MALFLTLFSTIFSGYTVVGVVGEAAGPLGFIATRWLSSAPIVGVATLIMVPRYYQLSRSRNYQSPTDFVSDRFDNRVLSILYSLIMSSQTIIYLVAQFYTIKNLVPILSGGQMDANTTTWFLAAVMWVVESIGGFRAIAKTDAIQSAVMIVSLIAVPCVATYYYHGASESVDLGCKNLETIDCTGLGLVCSNPAATFQNPAAFSNGCLLEANMFPGVPAANVSMMPLSRNGYKALYPATEWSDYWKPLYGKTLGTDSSKYFSHTAAEMFGFNLLFFAFSLNPHWLQRTLAGASATDVKKANMVMNFGSLVATLPGLLLGVMISANLMNVYPAEIEGRAPEPYAVLLSEFMDKGHFTEFVAVIGGVSVFAAIMSTVDSAMHGVTNCLTMDFLENWLFVAKPGLKENPQVILTVSRLISLAFMVLAVCIALYNDDLSDDAAVYGRLISWQNGLLWQIVPTTYLGLFMTDPKGWAHLTGIVVGFTVLISLYVYSEDQKHWGSEFADAKDGGEDEDVELKTYYFNSGSALWAGFANLIVTWFLNMLPGDGSASPAFTMGLKKHNSEGEEGRLTGRKLAEIMGPTTEPVKSPLGMAMLVVTMVLTTFSLPWYGDSYDDCDISSLFAWTKKGTMGGALDGRVGSCEGPELVGGLPEWAVVVIACYLVAMFTNFVAFTTWAPEVVPDTNAADGAPYKADDAKVDDAPAAPTIQQTQI